MVSALATCASKPVLKRINGCTEDRQAELASILRLVVARPRWRASRVEVASLDLGDQIEAEWLPLLGITYDDKDDVLEVALEGVDHLIYGPREVWADPSVGEMMSFEVIDDRGVSQIIKLRQPLMLPSPSPPMARD
jgi:Family of unknown function (DUF5335)